MRKLGAMSLLAATTLVAGLAATPASAVVSYQFTPVGTTPAGLPVSVDISFADGAGPVSGNKFAGDFNGMVAFLFKVGSFEADLAKLAAIQTTCDLPNPSLCSPLALDYVLGPGSGSIYFNNSDSDFLFAYNGDTASGFFNTDFVGPEACRISNTCNFRGTWTQVGEPASVALLLGAFALAGALRRRR